MRTLTLPPVVLLLTAAAAPAMEWEDGRIVVGWGLEQVDVPGQGEEAWDLSWHGGVTLTNSQVDDEGAGTVFAVAFDFQNSELDSKGWSVEHQQFLLRAQPGLVIGNRRISWELMAVVGAGYQWTTFNPDVGSDREDDGWCWQWGGETNISLNLWTHLVVGVGANYLMTLNEFNFDGGDYTQRGLVGQAFLGWRF